MSDNKVFVLESLKNKALIQLENRVEKYLVSKFYSDVLPKLIKDIKNNLIIDLINDDENLELKIQLKQKGDK